MKKLSTILTVASIGVIAFEVGSTVFAVANVFIQRRKAAKEIINLRTTEDKNIIASCNELTDKVRELYKKEAAKNVHVVVDMNKVDRAPFADHSAKAAECYDVLVKNSIEGIVSGEELQEAFVPVPELKSKINDVIGKAKKDIIKAQRTEAENALIEKQKDAIVAYSELMAKERGLLPGYFGAMHALAVTMRRNGVPRIVPAFIFASPAALATTAACLYLRRARVILNDAYIS